MQRLKIIAVRVAEEIGDGALVLAFTGLCLWLFIDSHGAALWVLWLALPVLAVNGWFAAHEEAEAARQVEAAREQGREEASR